MSTEQSWADRAPPHNQDAEQAILGGCLIDRTALIKSRAALQSSDFYVLAHQEIFRAICSLADAGQVVDIITTADRLRDVDSVARIGGLSYIGQLAEATPTTANIEAHVRIVERAATRRRFIARCREAMDKAYTQDDMDALLQTAAQLPATMAIRSSGGLRKPATVEWVHQQRAAIGNETPYIATGFRDLDSAVPLVRGEFTLLVGSSATGKTTVAKALAVNIARGRGMPKPLPVAWFSLEMSDTQLYQKLVAEEAQIDIQSLRTGALGDLEWCHMESAAQRLAALPLWIDTTGGVTLETMRREVMRLKLHEPKLSLVLIDYLGITGDKAGRNERDDLLLERLAYECKNMAKESNVHVIALAQGTFDYEGHRGIIDPSMKDVRRSRGMVPALDNMLFLLRPSRYPDASIRVNRQEIPCNDQRLENALLCYVLKERMGGEGKPQVIPFYWASGRLAGLAHPWPWQPGAEAPKPSALASAPPAPQQDIGL